MHEDDTPPDFSRRSLITTAPLVPLAAISAAAATAESVLTQPQLRLVEAFVDRLIPSDENGPGARECGVPTYIDRSLAGYLTPERSAFTEGLAAADALARSRYSAGFAELDAAKRDELLTAMENNDATGFKPDSRTFFYR